MMAEILAIEAYQISYGLDTDHPWASCLVTEADENPYYHHLGKYMSLYKDIKASSLGISFDRFMAFPQSELLILLETLSKKDPPLTKTDS